MSLVPILPPLHGDFNNSEILSTFIIIIIINNNNCHYNILEGIIDSSFI